MRFIGFIQEVQPGIPAIPIVNVPAGAEPNAWFTSIPLLVSGIIAIATLAIIPVIKALGDIKKQNELAVQERAAASLQNNEIIKQGEEQKIKTEEVHKIVNGNLTKQTEDLKLANERIAQLAAAVAQLTEIATKSRARRASAKRRITRDTRPRVSR